MQGGVQGWYKSFAVVVVVKKLNPEEQTFFLPPLSPLLTKEGGDEKNPLCKEGDEVVHVINANSPKNSYTFMGFPQFFSFVLILTLT